MKRTPLARKTPLKSSGGLKRSAMRKKPRRKGKLPAEAYRLVMGRQGGMCEAGSPDCSGHAEEWHHRQFRSRGGDDTPENGLAVCYNCHRWIEHHIAEATENGWAVHSWDDPADVPVLSRGRWVHLDGTGVHPIHEGGVQ